VVRCWEPRDAPALKEAVDSSLDHLLPWMRWAAREPQPLEEKVELLRRLRGQFDLGEDFVYGLFSRDEDVAVGGSGLHRRIGENGLEIGYWLRANRVGEGLVTESTAALTRVAFEVCGVDRVAIHVDPENERSALIPRRLGFVEEARLRRRLPAYEPGGEPRDMIVFVLFRDAFPGSPAASAPLEAFDAAGTRVL